MGPTASRGARARTWHGRLPGRLAQQKLRTATAEQAPDVGRSPFHPQPSSASPVVLGNNHQQRVDPLAVALRDDNPVRVWLGPDGLAHLVHGGAQYRFGLCRVRTVDRQTPPELPGQIVVERLLPSSARAPSRLSHPAAVVLLRPCPALIVTLRLSNDL